MRTTPQPPTWSRHDAAVWTTCAVLSALLAGETQRLEALVADFPPQLATDETLLAAGGFELLVHRAVGDGTYAHRVAPVVAAGRVSLGVTLAAASAGGVANRRRRQRAIVDAEPRWVVDDRGSLWVSTAGFYLQTGTGLFPWSWQALASSRLVGAGAVHLQGSGDNGPVSWVIRSDWAELLFVLWALTRHPHHPQLAHGGWQPPGWQDRCRANGFVPTAYQQGLTPRRSLPGDGPQAAADDAVHSPSSSS